jgi:hypothetical protein
LKTIFHSKSNTTRGHFYYNFRQDPKVAGMFTTLDKKEHAHYRRMLSPAFAPSALDAMEERMLKHIETFVLVVAPSRPSEPHGSGWSRGYNLAQWCGYLAYDVLGDLCLGQSFDMLQKPDFRPVVEHITQALHRQYIV